MPNVTVPLVIRDLIEPDLDSLQWSGRASHLLSVREQLDRVDSGDVEYLVAIVPSGLPVGKAGIDYTQHKGAGTIYQAAVHPALQSCGIGTLLVAEAERRIAARGHAYAELSVERDNPRARALYERLGYVGYGEASDEWDADGPDGELVRYHTVCTLMRKRLEDTNA
jgi:ribosomal protein S18 acetylase RimI-like enzyme